MAVQNFKFVKPTLQLQVLPVEGKWMKMEKSSLRANDLSMVANFLFYFILFFMAEDLDV